MQKELSELETYLAVLSADTGWEIFIYDFYGLLRDGGPLTILRRDSWHNNAYCVALKQDQRLHRRCVNGRMGFLEKIREAEKPFTAVCLGGVGERIAPVRVGGVCVGGIGVCGLLGNCSERHLRTLAHRAGCTSSQLTALRHTHLMPPDFALIDRMDVYLSVMVRLFAAVAQKKRVLFSGDQKGVAWQYVQEAQRFIELSFTTDITAQAVADECHISLSYLQHLFLAYEGRGVYNEIMNRRFEQAKRLLLTTEKSIRQIALDSGFCDPDYFSAAFKKRIGCSPRAFRKGDGKGKTE